MSKIHKAISPMTDREKTRVQVTWLEEAVAGNETSVQLCEQALSGSLRAIEQLRNDWQDTELGAKIPEE